jgi:hypothetical protein
LSDYYELDKPFSISDWNTLIGDVNDILQAPPAGASNCPPVDPIPEVTDPHLWSVEDVIEMRDKLQETCPDISFSEELVLWRAPIIDEIEEEMEKAWCDCETEPDEQDQITCTVGHSAVNAAESEEKSTGVIEKDPCAICIGLLCHEVEYRGDYYPSPSPNNDPKYNTICDTWDTAYYGLGNFITFMNKLPELGKGIEFYQGKIDAEVAQVDALIEQYEDQCLGVTPVTLECQTLKFQICQHGTLASDYQDSLNDVLAEFQDWYSQGIALLPVINSAAAQNMEAVLGLYGRYPADKNIFAECHAGAFPDWPWYDWWDPATMDILADKWDWALNQVSDSSDGVWPAADVYRINSRYGRTYDRKDVRIAPDGTWFVEGMTAKVNNRSYSQTYYEWRNRWRCESITGSCDPDPGNCQYPEWGEFNVVWWSQGWPSEGSCVGSCTGFGCWIWSPLPPPNWEKLGTDEFHLHTKRKGGMQDNSEKRDEWLEEHNNWHDYHEEYDDRHSSYC